MLKQLDSATERKRCRVIEKIRVKAGLGVGLNLIEQKKNFDRRTLKKMSANAKTSDKEGVWCKKNLNLSDPDT